MPAFFARWPDGSFSIVAAEDERDAYIQLDEFGDEPAELWPMPSCLLDFDLAEDGTFRLKQFGELTRDEILERGYPVLKTALEAEEFAEHAIEGNPEGQDYSAPETKVLQEAVRAERTRLASFQRSPATTERGKDIQRELGGSGPYIDAIVEQVAAERLRKYKPGKKRKPS